MPLEGHLDELRRRLITSAIAVLPMFVALFLLSHPVLVLIRDSARPYIQTLHALSPQEVFFTYLRVDFVLSLVAASPIWLYQALAFFLPAFGRRARNLVLRLLPTMILLFLLGTAFGLKVLLPIILRFLVAFGGRVVLPEYTLGNYTTFMLGVILPPGFLFEMPLIAYGLASAGLVRASMLVRGWRFAILGAAIVSAIFAPPGPLPMLALGLPILALYQASILVAGVTERRRARRLRTGDGEGDGEGERDSDGVDSGG